MQRVWSEDELVARWSLAPEDLALVRGAAAQVPGKPDRGAARGRANCGKGWA
jgi:hypothetical protein